MRFKLFSQRKQDAEREGKPVIFQYDVIPSTVRVQIVHVLRETLGTPQPYPTYSGKLWLHAHKFLIQERGVFFLTEAHLSLDDDCIKLILHGKEDDVLDVLEVCLRTMSVMPKNLSSQEWAESKISMDLNRAVDEINYRFRQSDTGYEYNKEINQLVRIDSQYIHKEIIGESIELMYNNKFGGALEEFVNAHRHYNKKENKQAISEAHKAVESTMKSICNKNTWVYNNGANSKDLINLLYEKRFIPNYMQSQFTGLRSLLESGLPTIRNKTSGHGQGATLVSVPDHLAAYAIHLAASTIVFLIRSFEAQEPQP